MFGTAWRIARIRGIDLRIDASWLPIAALIAYSFYARFEALYEELTRGEAIALAVVSAIVFFGSVVVHEFAHAFMSLARGIPVRSITLFLFGGATAAEVESRGPKEEFLISVVGPLSSLAMAVVLGIAGQVTGGEDDAIAGTLGYLAWINVSLAVFNLLPGLPLDGGRVFRSALWGLTGDLHKATRVAATAGRILGYALVGAGVLSLFAGNAGGLWLAFIGWFLAQAANASYAELELRGAIEGVEAEDVMVRDLITIPPDLTLAEAVDGYFLRRHHSAFPVEDGGRIVGLLTLRAVRAVEPEDRQSRRVVDTMTPLDRVTTVPRHLRLHAVLERFGDDEASRVLVCDGPRVVGLITPRDVAQWLQRSKELKLGEDRASTGRDPRTPVSADRWP